MIRKIVFVLLSGLIVISPPAFALECEVEYKAKRIKEKVRWFGKVEKPEFTSGIAFGSGHNKKVCVSNALHDIRKDGWTITYHKLIRKHH